MPLHRVAQAVLTLLLVAPLGAFTPATASAGQRPTGAAAAATLTPATASAGQRPGGALRAVITFDKSWRNPQRSRLH
jgi:hypothetical protein